MLLMRPEEPLFFAHAERVLARVRERERARREQTRVLVLSMEMCDDLDSSTVEALGEMAEAFNRGGRTLLFARLKDRPRQALERGRRLRALAATDASPRPKPVDTGRRHVSWSNHRVVGADIS
ncbi:MAG: sodium-independent anion transporter [Proteobacteria bacterium]|nr:sodium-independent anion transporter [Pseudomonadota bacterium]